MLRSSSLKTRPRFLLGALTLLGCLAVNGPAPALAQDKEPAPLPRFAALQGEKVNVRTGPGKQFPTRWVYTRGGLPVKIVEESDVWRKIQDPEGDQGWVHNSLLSRRRTVLVTGGVRELRRNPSKEARVVLRAEPGVIGKLLDCSAGWCFLEIDERRGWMERGALWGVLDSEMRG